LDRGSSRRPFADDMQQHLLALGHREMRLARAAAFLGAEEFARRD